MLFADFIKRLCIQGLRRLRESRVNESKNLRCLSLNVYPMLGLHNCHLSHLLLLAIKTFLTLEHPMCSVTKVIENQMLHCTYKVPINDLPCESLQKRFYANAD
ncbi:hypothetical protein QLX08_005964 [Tetragonisca angustula]|uniref:Uncharacterized protein n=1 Tax=Tetragonisca angustula TaxID=166442 RepID=A0AAW0ZVS0_9HYME